jgi:hypothetical protein
VRLQDVIQEVLVQTQTTSVGPGAWPASPHITIAAAGVKDFRHDSRYPSDSFLVAAVLIVCGSPEEAFIHVYRNY